MNNFELPKKHFNILKLKYQQADQYKESTCENFLYMILRKVDLGIHVTNLEFQWLKKNNLSETIEIISIYQYQIGEKQRLENETIGLRKSIMSRLKDSVLQFLKSPKSIAEIQDKTITMNRELQQKHFNVLRLKYQQGDQYKKSTSENFLYMILRKVDLGIHITDIELQWLKKNELFKTIEIINLYQYQIAEKQRLENEFLELRNKYNIPKDLEIPNSSPIYSILYKLDNDLTVIDSEIKLLSEYGCTETVNLIQHINDFCSLKQKYKVGNNTSKIPTEPLYSILKKLNLRNELIESEVTWLLRSEHKEAQSIYQQRENERRSTFEFAQLKSKYQVESYPDKAITSRLYPILKSINTGKILNLEDRKWLQSKKMHTLVQLDEDLKIKNIFAKLKELYKATAHTDIEVSGELFKILVKIAFCDSSTSSLSVEIAFLPDQFKCDLSEQDIKWLTNEGLTESANIAQQIYFKFLKAKYQVIGQLPVNPFYEIMLKIEREERLDPKQVVQLIEEGRLSRHGKIAIAYYRLEAIFYEKEYQRTGNRWNLPSASSNWRKADEPEQALKVTENINWGKVKETDLKSALLVTRGAAFRDLVKLDEAENCANQAIECQPNNHQPYTLMGAICYDRGQYVDGDKWFSMAIERGASDTDDEIKRIVRMTKDKEKRREVIEYLLNKDKKLYAWANSYLKE